MTSILQTNTAILRQLIDQTGARANQSFHVMPDLSKAIGDFSGETTPQDAKAWIRNLEQTAHMNSWPDAFTLEKARCHLVGAAKNWLRNRQVAL